MGRVMRNPVYCICENKYADKLRGVRAADRCLCFCCLDSKSEDQWSCKRSPDYIFPRYNHKCEMRKRGNINFLDAALS